MRRLALIAATLTASLAGASTATASVSLRPIGSFEQPIHVTSSPTNPDRLLIAEREGRIVESAPSGVEPLLDLTALVTCCESERGLLSILPAPDFEASGRIYVAYTGRPAAGGAEGDIHVDSFRPDPGGDEPIREPILSVPHAERANHYGGQLQLGPDGHLYIAFGDGGGTGDPLENAQDTEELLGKVIRIDPHPGQVPAYTSPSDNPFAAGPGRDEIWSYGLRNPWRFSFDRLTGDMVIGDVGQGEREEVDFAPSPGGGAVSGAGANYGWNCREGLLAYPEPSPLCATAGDFTEPVFDYVHQNPVDGAASGCSIIGGYVVRDPGLDGLYGRYVYIDYCAGQIRSLVLPVAAGGQASDDRSVGPAVSVPTSFGEDSLGRIYIASREGAVYRLVGSTQTSAAATGGGAGAAAEPPPVALRLRARSRGRWLTIVVRALPCAGQAGERVQLRRGGKPWGSRRLSDECVARFRVRVDRAATFRALLTGDATVRSRPLSVRPPEPGPSR